MFCSSWYRRHQYICNGSATPSIHSTFSRRLLSFNVDQLLSKCEYARQSNQPVYDQGLHGVVDSNERQMGLTLFHHRLFSAVQMLFTDIGQLGTPVIQIIGEWNPVPITNRGCYYELSASAKVFRNANMLRQSNRLHG